MKLHQIKFVHVAPKDRQEGIVKYVLVDDEAAIRDRIDAELNYEAWAGRADDEPLDIYDDDYNVIGRETWAERMLRIRGEMNDEDADYSTAYYGITHYGWDEGAEIDEADAAVLLRLGIAEDWRATS